jgi:hypothetical protein
VTGIPHEEARSNRKGMPERLTSVFSPNRASGTASRREKLASAWLVRMSMLKKIAMRVIWQPAVLFSILIVRCCGCKKLLGFKNGGGIWGTSHGYCKKCAEAQLRKYLESKGEAA